MQKSGLERRGRRFPRERMRFEQRSHAFVDGIVRGRAVRCEGEGPLQDPRARPLDLAVLDAERPQIASDAIARAAPIEERALEERDPDAVYTAFERAFHGSTCSPRWAFSVVESVVVSVVFSVVWSVVLSVVLPDAVHLTASDVRAAFTAA